MSKHTVTGPQRVAGVAPGGTVDLDPDKYNVPELVRTRKVSEALEDDTVLDHVDQPRSKRSRPAVHVVQDGARSEPEADR